MISIKDLYSVLSAMVPLYAAMFVAYGSVRWWKIFTPVQCSGINRFVAIFAVPLLSFHFISSNNPYTMDGTFILADTVSKIAVFLLLAAWAKFSRYGSLDWLITLFSLATLPNTLVMGIPLLQSMYGQFYGGLMVQLVVLQCIVWYTLLLFLFEYRAARLLLMEQFPETAASIISFKVDSDVISLDGRAPLQTQAEVGDDGKIRVIIRKSISSSQPIDLFGSPRRSMGLDMYASPRRSMGLGSMPSSKAITPRPSNLTGAEIYSIHSSQNTPRDLSFNNFNPPLWSTRAASPRQSNFTSCELYSVQSSRCPTPRASNVNNEDNHRELHTAARSVTPCLPPPPSSVPAGHMLGVRSLARNGISFQENHGGMQSGSGVNGNAAARTGHSGASDAGQKDKNILDPKAPSRPEDDGKELHMFMWSSSASPQISEAGITAFGGGSGFGIAENLGPLHESKEAPVSSNDHKENKDAHEPPATAPAPFDCEDFDFGSRATFPGDLDSPIQKHGQDMPKSSSASQYQKPRSSRRPKELPSSTVMVKLILQMVGRKLLRNPNTYSSLIGLIWALISFRFHIEMPKIVSGSISILSDAGLGMAMFSLGLFMALQPRLIACGTSLAVFAMAVRFLTGPAVMAAASIAVGLRGVQLHAAIVQAALPQGIVPFVFAREYDLHPDILSTSVIFGMLVALPVTLLYYVLLGL